MKMAHQGASWKDGNVAAPTAVTGRPMGKGYQMEPLLPGKGSVGNLQLEASTKRINTPALRALFEDEITAEFDKSGAQYSMKDVIRLAEQAMASATITEFLDKFVEFTHEQAYARRVDFEYCNKDGRQQYLVHIDNGVFYKDDLHTTPFTTDVGGPGWGLYALDLNQRLYVKLATGVADGAFNHSSFTSGRPVICAGAIEVGPGGRLRSISNESGHYRPGLGDLAQALVILGEEFNVNLVGVEAVGSTASGKTTMDAFVCMNIYRNYPRTRLADF